ncbi:MAG: sugar diacid recognition domain-containing protein [Thermovirgaceae bacterium]|nr:sugar diacid recognition domain-containing protein [Synergistales bacterium]HPC75302.1 sugar diacid recognition domain-containing protein [Synergistales bacterium]HRS48261.1 sugar diacid recognition domain-containing protein [Thermovirgaceae bacterium]HRU90545.1 sugar diacid recognition domain-containing protein [Thermovirgaceae bacterium]
MLKRFAQEICDITNDIIGHHVLITDEKGLTLGSSDLSRLGAVHTPSLECMRSRAETFTDSEEASRLEGVKPGVTLPVCLAGEVVGSIAIAGDHREVARYGYLVQKQAELFLKEQMMQESAGARDRAVQELISYIASFAPGHDDPGILATRIRELGFEPYVPRVCLVLEPGSARPGAAGKGLDPLERVSLFKEIHEIILSVFPEPLNFGSSLGGARFAVFAAIKEVEGGAVLDHAVSGCQRCREKMKGMGLILTVGAGSPAQTLEELHYSYLDAWKALTIGLKKNDPGGTHSIDDYRLEDLLTTVNTKKGRRFASKTLSGLKEAPDREEMFRTFKAWCRHPCSPGLVAKDLNIHRNTLSYRIQKIRKLTGLDIRDLGEAFELFLAATLDALLD